MCVCAYHSHVSPANSQSDATNPTKSTTKDDAPQDQLKTTDANKDAFASNQSVSAMTPPNGDIVAPTDAPDTDVKDVDMPDATTESANPPSPPADPLAKATPSAPEAEKTAETETGAAVEEPASKPSPAAEATEALEAEIASETKEKPDSSLAPLNTAMEGIDTAATTSQGAKPADLETPTSSMTKMGLDDKLASEASQQTAAETATADTSMTDAPSQASAKVAREREDDEDEERAAKRTKTAGEQAAEAEAAQTKSEPSVAPDAMVVDPPADAPAPTSGPAGPAPAPSPRPAATKSSPVPLSVDGKARKLDDPALDSNPITLWQNREIRKVLGLVKKTKCGQAFAKSVQQLWPQLWEQYKSFITRPVDISSIEQNLRENKYPTIGHFRRDVELIEQNAATFNGASHEVTASARTTVQEVYKRLSAISAEEPAKPPKQEPKQMPTRHAEPRNPPPPKKEARPAPAASSPVEKTNEAQIYALLPSGLPNIRRDSTKNDGDRPKRPIHPPKNKDIGFPAKTTKNKKKPELKFCEEVLKDIRSTKHWVQNQWFMEPVDPVAMNIPTYFSIVKQPMDLGTMNDKMTRGEYETAKDFKADFGLIVKNCLKFNGEDHTVSTGARELEKVFDKKWSEKASWLSKHAQQSAPPASATSPRGGTRDDSEDGYDSEAEAEPQDSTAADIVEVQRAIDALTNRLKKEQSEVDKKLYSANPDMSDIDMHRGIITHLQNQMVEKRQALTKLQESKKGEKPKATKKKATGGAGASGSTATKKTGGGGGAKKTGGGAAAAKKPTKKKLNEQEKEIVSEAIARLEANALDKAIAIIKKDTGLKVSANAWQCACFKQMTKCLFRPRTTNLNWIWTS